MTDVEYAVGFAVAQSGDCAGPVRIAMKRLATTHFRRGVQAAVVMIVVLAAGCAPAITLMPTPVIFQGGRINLLADVPPEQQTNLIDVFYATERSGKGEPDNRRYTNGVESNLQLGRATIRFGDRDESWQSLVEASLSSSRTRSITLKLMRATEIGVLSPDGASGQGSELTAGERAFADAINQALRNVAQPEVSIYVQGFRDDFEGSVAVTAELRHFLGRRQVLIAYAWPCRQRLVNYSGDITRAENAAPNFARLIEFLALHTKAQHINVLAYSAGATIAVDALVMLRQRHAGLDEPGLRQTFRVGNVILAAANLDLQTFVKSQLAIVTQIPTYVEITMSTNDTAMSLAQVIHGSSRVGDPQIEELTPQDVDEVTKQTKLYAIDVSAVGGPHAGDSGIGGHGYWYANPWISSDILMTLIWQLPPDQRGLVQISGRHAWTFPSDYPDRVHQVLTEQIRLLRQKQSDPDAVSAAMKPPKDGKS